MPVGVEARPDRADQAVVVEVEHDTGARAPGRGERAPAERRVDVVRVDDAGAGAPHGGRDLVRVQAAREHPRRRLRAAERGRVALEDLGVLAEVLADEPREVLDDAFLAAGHAVAVVQEEDHAAGEASLCARMDLAVQIVNFNTKAHLVPCLDSVVAALARSGSAVACWSSRTARATI